MPLGTVKVGLRGAAEWVDGKFGKGISFDGSSGYVEIPFNESIRVLNQGDFTIAVWLMQKEEPGEWQGIFQQTDVNGTDRAWIRIKLNRDIVTWLGGSAMPAGIIVELGEWYHVAAIVTEGGGIDTVQLYINGEPLVEASKGMEDCEGNYFIGCHKTVSNFWSGIIDDVVLIRKELDAAELEDLMENGIESFLTVESAGKLVISWGNIKDNLEL